MRVSHSTGKKQDAPPRNSSGQFTKGSSGNPGGRPKLPAELKQAFQEAAPEALRVLLDIMLDEEARAADRIRCAEVILERGYGKPAQEVSLTAAESAGDVGIIMLPAVAPDAKKAVRGDE